MLFRMNGYIIQRIIDSYYKGVEGDNWYLNYCSKDTYFENYFKDNIDNSWTESNFVDCCNDDVYIQKYIQESRKIGIKYRVLLCSTCKENPKMINSMTGDGEFLGYDYAYSGGSYYSAVLNDIVSQRIKEFSNIRLNKNGLFESYEEISKFIADRNRIKNYISDIVIEDGDFIIYKLCEIKI